MNMFEKPISVKRVVMGVGINPQGQQVNISHVANASTIISIIPGKLCIVEVTKPDGGKVVREVPITTFGWEYDVLDDPNGSKQQ